MELERVGEGAKYDLRQVGRVLDGEAGSAHLQVGTVAAYVRALEVTSAIERAQMYAAAGHKPPDVTLEKYAELFDEPFPVAS